MNVLKNGPASPPIAQGGFGGVGWGCGGVRTIWLAKLAKWLSCVVTTYRYSAFECMFYNVMCAFLSESTLYGYLVAWIHSKTHMDICDIITYKQIHRTDKFSQHSSIIWPVWLNVWALVYELSDCGFESCYSHLNSRYCACLEHKEILDIQAAFTLKHLHGMIITYNHCFDSLSFE